MILIFGALSRVTTNFEVQFYFAFGSLYENRYVPGGLFTNGPPRFDCRVEANFFLGSGYTGYRINTIFLVSVHFSPPTVSR